MGLPYARRGRRRAAAARRAVLELRPISRRRPRSRPSTYFANRAVRAAAARHGIAVEAHRPLGHDGKPLTDETITGIAAARGKSTAQVILRWHLQQGTIVIPKSANAARMAENLAVLDFELSAAEIAAIDALDRGESGRVGPNPDTYAGI